MRKIMLFMGVVFVLLFSGCGDKVVVVVAVDDRAEVVVNGSVIIDVLVNDIVPEGETKSIQSATNGMHGNVEIMENQTIIYTPEDGYAGRDTFTYILQVESGTDEASVTIRIVDPEALENKAPYARAGSDKYMELSETISIIGQDSDSDGHIVDKKWSLDTVVLASARTFEYTPTSLGEKILIYTVTDNDNASASDTMSVFVTESSSENHAPEANNANVDLDSCDIGTEIPIQLQATDEDDDSLVYSIDNSGLDYGTVTLTDEDAGTALFTIDDSEAQNACFDGMSNSFTFKVNDGTEDSDSATITIVAPEPV